MKNMKKYRRIESYIDFLSKQNKANDIQIDTYTANGIVYNLILKIQEKEGEDYKEYSGPGLGKYLKEIGLTSENQVITGIIINEENEDEIIISSIFHDSEEEELIQNKNNLLPN